MVDQVDKSPLLSADSLASSRRGSSESPSINDDLANFDMAQSPNVQRIKGRHLRNISISSLYSFAQTADDSSIVLGTNKLSESTVSPLQQNSIFELIHNADNHRRTSTGLLTINSGNATINLRGPTVRDIPPTTLTKIEKAKSSIVEKYLSEIEPVYNQFQTNQTLTEETLGAYMQQLAEEEKTHNVHMAQDHSIVSKNENFDDADEREMEENSLKTIPEIYFSSDFRLDNPRVFDQVIENSSLLSDSTRDFNGNGVVKPLVDNNAIQEKLSSYLDVVEIHLIHEISKSSNSFFAAIDDLKNITQKSKIVAEQLKSIDSKLESLEKNQAHGATEILKLIQKRNNVEKLEQALLQIHSILHQADLSEASYFAANYEKALENIDAVFALISGNKPPHPIINKRVAKWKYPLLDLNRMHALSPLKKNLMLLVAETGKSYSKLFANFLIEDLRAHYENTRSEDTLSRLSEELAKNRRLRQFARSVKQVNPTYNILSDDFKHQTKVHLTGLARCGEMVSAFAMFEERFIAEFKNIIKTHLPTDIYEAESQHSTVRGSMSVRSDGSSTAVSGSGGGLSNNVKAMTPKEFEEMLVGIYTQLSEALRRLKAQQKYLLQMAIECLTVNDPHLMDNEPDLIMQLDITAAINQTIEITQSRIAKIISVRREQTASIALSFFLRFYSVNVLFMNECEMISGSILTQSMQDIINLQTRLYETEFHSTNMKLLPERVEKEIWKEASLPLSTQTIVNEIIKAASEDMWVEEMQITTQSALNADNPDNEEHRKTLVVSDKSIIVPEVAVYLLKIVKEYCMFKIAFPGSSSRNITQLFSLLNLKISQSVLGAGATRTAGLKHITSRHLAIASQFLDFLLEIIPFIQQCYARVEKVESSKSADEFKDVLNNIKEHKEEIFDKLVAIMADKVKILSHEIKTIDWSSLLPQQQVHHYIENLIDQTLKIARVLQRYLPEDQHTYILSKIFEEYRNTLIDSYSQIKLEDSVEKAVMMRDVDYFREKLGDLSGYGTSGQLIWEAVNDLPTEEDTRMEQVMGNDVLQEPRLSSPEPPVSASESTINLKDVGEVIDKALPPTPSEIDQEISKVDNEPSSQEPKENDTGELQDTKKEAEPEVPQENVESSIEPQLEVKEGESQPKSPAEDGSQDGIKETVAEEIKEVTPKESEPETTSEPEKESEKTVNTFKEESEENSKEAKEEPKEE